MEIQPNKVETDYRGWKITIWCSDHGTYLCHAYKRYSEDGIYGQCAFEGIDSQALLNSAKRYLDIYYAE